MPGKNDRIAAHVNAAEELLRDLFENTTELIQSLTPDGHFLFVNRAWRETLGYSVEEIQSLTFLDVVHLDHHEVIGGLLEQILAGEDVGKFETEFVCGNGEVITVSGHCSAKMEGELVVSTRGFFIDITEQKRLEAERDLSYREMEKAIAQVKALTELMPVCSWCKKVRHEEDEWLSLENYLLSHPDIRVTHGMCPACFDQMKLDIDNQGKKA
ncbi:MAG: PAS domain-containing protein [Limisphaerales bacterium]